MGALTNESLAPEFGRTSGHGDGQVIRFYSRMLVFPARSMLAMIDRVLCPNTTLERGWWRGTPYNMQVDCWTASSVAAKLSQLVQPAM